jgi:hypothetical protein
MYFRVLLCLFPLLTEGRNKAVTGDFDFEHYHNYTDFERYLTDVSKRYPHIVELREIGKSREGRNIIGLKVHN